MALAGARGQSAMAFRIPNMMSSCSPTDVQAGLREEGGFFCGENAEETENLEDKSGPCV